MAAKGFLMSLKNVAIGIDQLVNTFFGGTPDETLSSRCFRLARINNQPSSIAEFAMKQIDKLFFWQKNHCYNAFLTELARKQLPSVYQNSSLLNMYHSELDKLKK